MYLPSFYKVLLKHSRGENNAMSFQLHDLSIAEWSVLIVEQCRIDIHAKIIVITV